jgi:hypothetical protein
MDYELDKETTTPVAHLTLVTENQAQKRLAEELASCLRTEFGECCTLHSIEEYTKFENAFKIELELRLDIRENFILQGIALTDKIVSPWAIYFDSEDNNAELIFNKDGNSRFRKKAFAAIRWGHWRI